MYKPQKENQYRTYDQLDWSIVCWVSLKPLHHTFWVETFISSNRRKTLKFFLEFRPLVKHWARKRSALDTTFQNPVPSSTMSTYLHQNWYCIQTNIDYNKSKSKYMEKKLGIMVANNIWLLKNLKDFNIHLHQSWSKTRSPSNLYRHAYRRILIQLLEMRPCIMI